MKMRNAASETSKKFNVFYNLSLYLFYFKQQNYFMVLIWIKFSDIKQFFGEWSYDMQVKTFFFFL